MRHVFLPFIMVNCKIAFVLDFVFFVLCNIPG